MKKGLNKRGQDLSIATLILIVLGIVILVLLIGGFSLGWGNLWEKVNIFSGGKSNVGTINQACQLACTQQNTYNFCSEQRDLELQNKKTTTGSCNDFATKNPSLGIEGCSLCSAPSEGCKIQNQADTNCDGEPNQLTQETSGANKDYYFFQADTSDLKENDGKQNLEKIKAELNIPDKFCYWEALAEVYKEKCPQLSYLELDQIFEKKRQYYEANRDVWPWTNFDEDYCVPVIFSYEEWDPGPRASGAPAGYWNHETININPYYEWEKEYLSHVLLHEGVHSLQKAEAEVIDTSEMTSQERWDAIQKAFETDTHVGTGEESQGVISQADGTQVLNDLEEANEYFKEISKNVCEQLEEKLYLLTELCIPPDFNSYYLYHEKIIFNPILEKIKESNPQEYKEAETLIAQLKAIIKEGYYKAKKTTVKGYVGSRVELQPRLSDVQRYWLDKECKIISTKEEAKYALDRFLADDSSESYYFLTRAELWALLDVYKREGKRDEVYNELITILPRIAQADGLIDQPTYT
ncbi:MAG: hypothetical protein KJ718_05195 [Nanoarchaeota archaeon]|nr:hypothetical protein [Nanoarchaeota archaeon]MBU1051922.1 hypothetical protein [Nanoarchaeota archaeon]